MFCVSGGKSCRDTLAVNGRKELAGLGVTRDRQPTSTTYASLCPNRLAHIVRQASMVDLIKMHN